MINFLSTPHFEFMVVASERLKVVQALSCMLLTQVKFASTAYQETPEHRVKNSGLVVLPLSPPE